MISTVYYSCLPFKFLPRILYVSAVDTLLCLFVVADYTCDLFLEVRIVKDIELPFISLEAFDIYPPADIFLR